MSLDTFQPLTAEEKKYYSKIFVSLDPQKRGFVAATGELSQLIEKTGFDPHNLYQAAKVNDSGVLNQLEFIKVMRLIGHLQSGKPLTSNLENMTAPLPILNNGGNNISPAMTGQSFSHLVPTSTANSVADASQIPALNPMEVPKFVQLFHRHVNGESMISGIEAKDIFLKTKLSDSVLEMIWNLVDRGLKGSLLVDEFCLAMHLIQSLLKGLLKSLPQSLPPRLWAQIAQILSSASAPMTQESTGNLLGLTTPSTTNLSRSTSVSAPVPIQPQISSNWIVTPLQKSQFDQIFDSLDKEHKGILGGDEIVPFLMTSKLSRDDLASVWGLADQNQSGQLTKREFAICMFLVQKRLKGEPLPATLPQSVLESLSGAASPAFSAASVPAAVQASSVAAPALMKAPQRTYSGQMQQQPATPLSRNVSMSGPPPLPPQVSLQSQSAQPHAQPQASAAAQPHAQKSSLNDLVDIFGTTPTPTPPSSSPAPPAPISRSNSLQVSSTGGSRRFHPSSNFGQQIIQEAEEDKTLLQLDKDEDDSGDDSDISYTYKPNNKTTATGGGAAAAPPIPTSAKPNYEALRDLGTNKASVGAVAGASAVAGIAGAAIGAAAHSGPSEEETKELKSLNDQIQQEHIGIANTSSQINSLQAQSSSLSGKIAEAKKELESVQQAKSQYQNRLNQVKAILEEESEQYESIKKFVVDSKTENESLRQKASILEAEYNTHQNEYHQYQAELTAKQNENAKFKEKLGTLTAEHDDLVKQLESIKIALKDQTTYNQTQERKIEVLQTQNSSLKNEVAKLEKDLKHATMSGNDKSAQVAALESENKEHESQLSSKSALTGAAVGAGALAAAGAIGAAVAHSDSSESRLSTTSSFAEITKAAQAAKAKSAAQAESAEHEKTLRGVPPPVPASRPHSKPIAPSSASEPVSKDVTPSTAHNNPFLNSSLVTNTSSASFSNSVGDSVFGNSSETGASNAVPVAAAAATATAAAAVGTAAVLSHSDEDQFTEFSNFPSQADFESHFDENLKSPTNTEKLTTTEHSKDTPDTSTQGSEYQFSAQNPTLPTILPRPESLTSSVQNNAPLSVRDEIEDDVKNVGDTDGVEFIDPSGIKTPTETQTFKAVDDDWFEDKSLEKTHVQNGSVGNNSHDLSNDFVREPLTMSDIGSTNGSVLTSTDHRMEPIRTSSFSTTTSDDFTDAREEIVSPTTDFSKFTNSNGFGNPKNVLGFSSDVNKSAATLKDGLSGAATGTATATGASAGFDDFDAAFDNLKPTTDETFANGIDNDVGQDDFDAAFSDLKPAVEKQTNDDFNEEFFDDLKPAALEPKDEFEQFDNDKFDNDEFDSAFKI